MMSQPGPQRYIAAPGAYQELPEFLHSLKVKRVLFLHGTRSLKAAKPYLPDLTAEFEVTDVLFGGECSYVEIDRIKAIAEQHHVDAVIALGGGKVLDTAKSVATGTPLYTVFIPTLASNCAPWSALSVHYHEDGSHDDFKVYNETANLLLFEPQVILHSPIDYFIAGIADTLAKYYESELIFDQLQPEDYTVALTLSQQSAKLCRQILLDSAIQAVKDMQAGQLTHTWQTVAETVIVTAGTVGGWGDEYARATGAHSIHDALCEFPETVKLLHGHKVGYGILVQLALEHHETEIIKLLPFYRTLGVPTNFETLGLGAVDQRVDQLAEYAADPSTTMHLIPVDTSAAAVAQAIRRVEVITRQH
ncbi:iron-containing alcohol dehydrogenase family protein [Lacticaseibacillus porcinae]|uniref:iron-containing alcohol dehydrogenase family protein n=1 Tax=Lacticaseibacillus porcinae TaxID=1123687 RepID=UPI000F7A5AE2|nr:iron-containing alcohol dehydrogenase family protein [Lacticaseibacillus porcinae]